MKFYNTLTRKKEIFKPIKDKKINLFVCGPTVYDYPHIGHAKTYIQFDAIVKYLRYKKYKVFYLQNITDIDDKIIKRANKEKTTYKKITDKFEKIYYEDIASLHVDSVTKYARATDFIPQIVSQVQRLIKKDYAYKTQDGYYFDLSKFSDYGKLSGRIALEAEDSVSRIDESVTKRNKGDFCLWKFSKPNEPSWKTKIGSGRPGWHIEDTAITEHFFGPQYDIHGGARDLIFPHHEAEIAQMESISGKKPLVKYWLHTGFLNLAGKKMSKSLGNFMTIKQALEKYNYKVLRFFFINNHYRSQIDFSPKLLEQAKNTLERINNFAINSKGKKDKVKSSLIEKTKKEFFNSLDNDFDTPKAFAILFEFIRKANKIGSGNKCLNLLKKINKIFDIFTLEQEKIPKEIQELIKQRESARKNKNYKESDLIREKIKQKGFLIEDSKQGYKIKKIK
jgi:cysteinyl-tRNA synthetase